MPDFSEQPEAAPAQRLDHPLSQLADSGLPRPEHLSVREYLQRLAASGLLSHHSVAAYLVLRQEHRQGNGGLDDGAAQQIVDRLSREVRTLAMWHAEQRQSLREQLDKPAEQTPAEHEAGHTYLPLPQPGSASATGSRFSGKSFVLLIGWSIFMLVLGYSQRTLIGSIFAGNEAAGYEQIVQTEHRLALYYEAQLAEEPSGADEAGLLNNYAWLLLTARDPQLRDPDRALKMARQAYTLTPEPTIADTLAEAYFQHGDLDRAIKLAEEALANTDEANRSHYKQQVTRFRRAAGQAENRD